MLLEDALHALVVGEGGAAHDLEVQRLEAVGDQELHCLTGVTATTQVFGADLYAELAPLALEVVEGNEADGLADFVLGSALTGFDNKGFNGRILPSGQVVAARGKE